MNKKFTLLITTGIMTFVVSAVAYSSGKSFSLHAGNECALGHHVGNHYLANDPDCAHAGNVEFWACCECLHQYTEEPAGGNWTDRGAFTGTLDPSHVAYVAPTGEHDYANRVTINDGVASIFSTCTECGDVIGDSLAEMNTKKNATFEHDLTGTDDGSRWAYDENTGVWKSTNAGRVNSSTYLWIKVLTAGSLSFEYTSSGEGGYDYMFFGPNTNEAQAYVNCKGSGTSVWNKSGSYSRDVVEGEKIVFVFKKDANGGDKGDDCGTVKFVEGTFTYKALTLNTNGGDSLAPMFIENGKIVGELPTPTYSGKYFEGWYVDSGFTTAVTETTTFDNDATIYAKWSDPLVVTLNANGGTCASTVSFQTGTTPEIPTPTRDGFVFLGWYTDSDFDDAYVSGNKTESFDLYAKWIAEEDAHKMYGTYAGFKFTPDSTSAPSETYAELTVDVTGAYSLRKYYSGFETGTLGSVNQDGTVTATNNGTVQSFDNGNVIVMHEGSSYSYSKSYFVMFKGLTTSNKSGTTSSSVKPYDLVTFVKFTYKTVDTIIMIDNATGLASFDVSIVNSKNVAINYSNLGAITQDAMYFTVKSSSGSEIGTYGYNNNKKKLTTTFVGIKGTFTAIDNATITFNGNGGAVASFINASSVDTVTADTAANTYIIANGTSYYKVVVNTDDGTFTYATAICAVTFDANNGVFSDTSSSKDVDIAMGPWFNPADKVEEPTRAGYTFNGWWGPSSTKAETWTQVKTSTFTFTAHWLKNITISFAETDDSAITGCDSVSGVEGEKIATLPTPTKSGFCFMGWYLEKTFTTPFTTDTILGNSDITVYAKWEAAVTLTIYYGEQDPKTVSCLPGVAPEFDVSKPGYGIEGYYAESTFDTPVDLSSGITTDTTVYVKYTDLRTFVGNYVGYNAYSNTVDKVITGSKLLDSYNSVINSDLTCTGKFANADSGCSIIGATATQLIMQKKTEVVYGIYTIASDGTVFVISHYTGFKNPCSLKGNDLAFCMSTGSSIDKTVTMKFVYGEDNHWIFTATKGTKTYTVDADITNGTLTVTSLVDSAA